MATITIPGQTLSTPLEAPIAPSAIGNQQIQNMSVYRAMRSLVQLATQDQTITLPPGESNFSFGTVATYASDGTPATFNKGELDGVLLRVYADGSSVAPSGAPMWVAGGGETQVAHTLTGGTDTSGNPIPRTPVGYWVVRNRLGAMISDGDSAWDSTYIYFHTTHSDSDIILWIF